MTSARSLLSTMSAGRKAAFAASVVGVLVLAFVLMQMATAPSYATLMTGIDPAETGKLTAVLDERGIPYELQNNGTAIGVEQARTAEARIALAEQGLPDSGAKPGFEIFDKQKLGASDFEQKVSYQRALEGEIARTIEQVDGVSGAQVSLVLPEDQLFEDEQTPATAAVLLAGATDGIEPESVRGMAQLVASSVQGLKTQNVSITNGSGQLIWPQGDGEEAGGEGVGRMAKQAAEERYERRLESELGAMLARTVGPDKAQVQVQAELNADESTREQLAYERRGVPLKTTTEEENLEGGGGAAGAAGTAGNIPNYPQGAAAGGESNYERNTESTENALGKTITRTAIAPGAVEGLDVALVLDRSVPPEAVAELRRAVESAAGVDEERGDTMAVSQLAFAKPATPPAPSPVDGALGAAPYAGLGLASLLFVLFVARHLRRREGEPLADAAWLREIEAPMPLAELAPPPAPATQALVPDPTDQMQREQVAAIVSNEPERVAQQVRAWMRDDTAVQQ